MKKRELARVIDGRNEVARHELGCAFLKLFVPRGPLEERVTRVIESEYGGVKLRVRAPVLDATDLGVLLAIYAIGQKQVYGRNLALSGEQPGLIDADLEREASNRQQTNGLAQAKSLRVETTVSEISVMTGHDGRDSDAADRIRLALEWLAMVVIAVEKDRSWGVTHMIAVAAEDRGRLSVLLDYRATGALLGSGQWAAISMEQWRACRRRGIERLLLHRIATLTTGRLVRVAIDTLAAACWPSKPKSGKKGDHILRYRRQEVTKALKAGRCVPQGIKATINGKGIVTFKKPAQIEPEDECGVLPAQVRGFACAPNPSNADAEPVPEDFPNAPKPLPLHEEATSISTGLQEEAKADRTGQQSLPIPEEVKRKTPEQIEAAMAATMPAVSDKRRAALIAGTQAKLDMVEKQLERMGWVMDPSTDWVAKHVERKFDRLASKRSLLQLRMRVDRMRPSAVKRGGAVADDARS